mgnify:CR=1 FL=1
MLSESGDGPARIFRIPSPAAMPIRRITDSVITTTLICAVRFICINLLSDDLESQLKPVTVSGSFTLIESSDAITALSPFCTSLRAREAVS